MNKSFLALFILLFTLPLFAQNTKHNTILIVGDSISAGYGIDPTKGWVNLLSARLKSQHYDYMVINSSISGATTSNGLSRLPQALSQYKPQITIIELGGNDGLRGLPLNIIKSNLQQMVQLAKDAGSRVVVVGVRLPPNYGPQYTQQFQQIYADLGKDSDVVVVPLFLKNIDTQPTLMQSDRVHPTAEAQSILLDNIWPSLQPLLSMP